MNAFRGSPETPYNLRLWRIGGGRMRPPKRIDQRARGENTDTYAGIARELNNRAD